METSIASRPEGRKLASRWLTSLGGQFVQAAAQAATFILLARGLGIDAFGTWVVLAAISALTSHVAGLGFGNLLVRNTVRDRRDFPVSWGNALLITLASGSALAFFARLLAPVVLPSRVPLPAVLVIFLADLVLARLVTLTAMACQGRKNITGMSGVLTVLSVARLLAVVGWMAWCDEHVLATWAVAYGAASAGSCVLVLAWALRTFPRPTCSLARVRLEWREGVYFVLSPYTQVVNNDADKVILGRVATPDAVGLYGAAYRAIAAAFLPVQSLLAVTYPTFFGRGREGLQAAARFGRTIAPIALGCATCASAAILLGAGAAPAVLGPAYAETAVALRWLSALPVLRAAQLVCGDTLTGANLQRRRTVIQAAAGALNIVLNVWWDPGFGWRGAASATLVSDGLLAAALYAATRVRPAETY